MDLEALRATNKTGFRAAISASGLRHCRSSLTYLGSVCSLLAPRLGSKSEISLPSPVSLAALSRRRVSVALAAGAFGFAIARPGPFVPAGILLAGIGLTLRLWAAGQLDKGGPLVTDGPYAAVRHPLYLGALLLAAGSAVAGTNPTRPWSSLCVWTAGALLSALYLARARKEDEELARRFEGFEPYRSAVPALLPAPALLPSAFASTRFDAARLLRNREHRAAGAFALLAVVLRLRQAYRW